MRKGFIVQSTNKERQPGLLINSVAPRIRARVLGGGKDPTVNSDRAPLRPQTRSYTNQRIHQIFLVAGPSPGLP